MFPVRVLRAYVHDETSPPVKTKSTLSDEEDETEYEIDQILAVRVQRNVPSHGVQLLATGLAATS